MASGPITSWQIEGRKVKVVADFIFLGSNTTADSDCGHEIKTCLLLGRKAMTNHTQHIKKQRHHFADKRPHSQSYGFSSSHIWMWELDHKECWALKNWYFQIVVLEKTLENPLDSKEIKPVIPKGNQLWIFIGRTDAEAAAPVLWPLTWRANSLKKTLMLGKVEGKRRRVQQRMRWLDSFTDATNINLSKLWEIVKEKEACCATVHRVTKSLTRLREWTTNMIPLIWGI